MDTVDTVIVGAGWLVLPLRELALRRHEVVVIEAAEAIGTETSSRNSEVIHSRGLMQVPLGEAEAP